MAAPSPWTVDGALSKGKARGAGLIFVLCVVLVALAFMPFHLETVIYMVLLIASMLSGYLDDASDTAWNEYKKGLIDFVIALVAGVTYLNFNGCGLYAEQLASYVTATAVFVGALLAYLWVNAKPSTVLMGDAGSRAMGFFLALLALKSAHPFAFLLAAAVFIVDGSLGIVKISLKRFLHISVLKNTLTPTTPASVWAGATSRWCSAG